ncbi:MAG: heavy metal translocating P-type ATPase [Zoogloeaceae bacterium]|nr:heavy metal translocating P-type ATPase [Zoogloeaceae bacterium]
MRSTKSSPAPLSYRPVRRRATAPALAAGIHDHACCGAAHAPSTCVEHLPLAPGEVQTRIRIMQMDCPTEQSLLHKKLGGMAGVGELGFNLMQRVLTVNHVPARIDAVLDAIRALGFTPEPLNEHAPQAPPHEPRKPWWPLAIATVIALGSEGAHWLHMPMWVSAGLALIAILACGTTTFRKGWIAVRNLDFNINALMSIAVTGALLIGQWPEAAMVMVLFTVAELIEARSLERARNAIRGLMTLAPDEATVQQSDGNWQVVAARDVGIGARVRVRPGERIALDGTLVSGSSTVSQAPITGESMPVEKTAGDPVYAGTVNQTGSFEYRVSARADDSTLARIIHAIEAAQGARAPTQRFVDAFARVYTPVVLAIAVAVALLPPLLFGGEWLAWVYKALVLLVIACPCALVISTPVTIVSGLAAAARCGILVKGGIYLERGRELAWIAIDKTGTLTLGKPAQTDFALLSDLDAGTVRRVAASLAARSDHPVSHALAEAARADGVDLSEVADFVALPGRGVRGVVDGRAWLLGNHRLIHERSLCGAALEARLGALEAQGKTVVMLADEGGVTALFAVADTVRPSSRKAVAELHALGIRTLMLSGDNNRTTRAIATQVGIDEAYGDLLPQDKLALIEIRAAAGTLTLGKPAQPDFALLSDLDAGTARRVAASLAARSDHPVSHALAEAARADGVDLSEVADFVALPGRGVRGVVDGRAWLLGNHRLIHERGLCGAALEARLGALEAQGKTVVMLADEGGVTALFAVADTVRPSSRKAVAELHALGIRTLMLSGDNNRTTRAIATQVGIDEAYGDLLPQDKLALIEKRAAAGTLIGMVGDGINDGPALARADIGFAMGAAGTGTAIETADVALMDDDLGKLPQFIRLSHRTHRLLVQNIVIALGIKGVFLVLTLIGLGSMWMAVFADVGASLIVVANGLRLLQTGDDTSEGFFHSAQQWAHR